MPKLKTKHSVIHCRVRTWRASRMLISIYSPSTIALLVLLLVSWFCSVKGASGRGLSHWSQDMDTRWGKMILQMCHWEDSIIIEHHQWHAYKIISPRWASMSRTSEIIPYRSHLSHYKTKKQTIIEAMRERVEIIEDDAHTTHRRRYVHMAFLLLPRRLFIELRC